MKIHCTHSLDCGCADGRKQRACIKKEDAAAPTVASTILSSSCIQDATQHLYAVIVDIPGACLQIDQPEDDEVIFQFYWPMVKALANIDPAIYNDKI